MPTSSAERRQPPTAVARALVRTLSIAVLYAESCASLRRRRPSDSTVPSSIQALAWDHVIGTEAVMPCGHIEVAQGEGEVRGTESATPSRTA